MSGVGRPVLALGTHGKISTRELTDGRFRATGTWRDMRGSRKPITATGATATEADSLLQQKFNKLGQAHMVTAAGITSESTIEALAHVYLHSLDNRKKKKLAIQSLSRYRSTTKNTILPRLGSLRLVELDQGVVDTFIEEVADDSPSQAKSARSVLSGMLRVAVKRSAVPYNYSAASKERVDNPNAKGSRALTVAEARLVWELIMADRDKTRHGPKTHTAHDTLAAVLALQVGGGGLRIGEAAALNVANVDWKSATVRINATVVYREPEGSVYAGGYGTPGGYIIQGHTKRREIRDVIVDDWVLDLLKDLEGKASPEGLIFHSKGRVLNLNNLRRTLRGALRGSSVDWVTPHSYRHTVATAVSRDEEFGIEDAARVLGHSSSNTTKGYVERENGTPDVRRITSRYKPMES